MLGSSATRSDIAAPEGPGIAEEEHNGEDDDADDTNKEALHLEPPLAAEPFLQHLRDCITEHINTPASVASGMSGLSHKVSTFVWQSALGVPTMRALKLFLASFMAMTSDFGTEIGIAGFEAESLESLLPSWFHLPRGEPEVDGRARQDEGDIEYDCEMPDCSSSATVERDVMSADESAHDEATEREPEAGAHEMAVAPPEPPVAPPSSTRVLPNCLPISGMQHLVHNLLLDVTIIKYNKDSTVSYRQ